MALFKISKGASGGLNNQALGDGYCWFTYDDGKFYIDYTDPTDNTIKRKALNADMADHDILQQDIEKTYVADINISGGFVTLLAGDGSTIRVVPIPKFLQEKTFTGVIGTANNAAEASFYFGKILPNSYNEVWQITYEVIAQATGETRAQGRYYVTMSGVQSTYINYSCFNTIMNTSYRPIYYQNLYRATQAGITNNYGHLLGVGLRASWNPAVVANARTITIKIMDCKNCSFTFFDNVMKYANAPGTGATNYSALTEIDACNNGLRETGDDNSYTLLQMSYNYLTNGAVLRLHPYTLFGLDRNGNAQGISLYSAGYTSSTANINTGRVYNTAGIDWTKGLLYLNSGTNFAVDSQVNISPTLAHSGIDFRNTDNCVAASAANNLGLVNKKPVFFRGVIKEDGLFYLAPIEVTYNNATYKRAWTQDIPTTIETDGTYQYVYWLIGYPYYNSSYPNSLYQMNLFENNPMYWYHNGRFEQYVENAAIADKAVADSSGNNIVNTYLTKASGVTNVAWDNTNKKLTKTINGSTTDVVAVTVNNPTLAWNTESVVAKIGTVDVKVKLPANPNTNTDTLVKQTAKIDSVEYKLLTTTSASPTSGAAAEAGYGVNLAYNPSLNRLSTGNVKLTGEIDVTGNATFHNQTQADSLTAGSLLVNGATNFVQSPIAPTPAGGDSSTKVATTAFVANSIASLSTAMHFIGKATVAITDGSTTNPAISGYDFTADRKPGDVIIDTDNAYEYVWTLEGKWERLGPDGSYKITQSAVDTGAATTNKWVSRIQQNANGVVTATLSSLDTSGTWSGKAAKLTDLNSSDSASSTTGWRKVWFSYSDGVTGRPALSDVLAFQTSTGTLKATIFSGSGASLTNLNASNISSGTLAAARLPSVTRTNNTSTASPAHSGTFTTIDSITTDTYGRVTAVNTKTITLPSDNNTTYTFAEGSTNGAFSVTPSGGSAQSVPIHGLGTAAYKAEDYYVKRSGDTMTGRLTADKGFVNLLIGTGTAGKDNGSSDTSTRYQPAKWTFNAGVTVVDGDIFTIKIPVAGHDYGVFMSVNNGTDYYPIVCNGTGRLTTHYPVNTYITVVFESTGSAASMFPLNGGMSRITTSNGAFRVINYYDSNSDYGYYSRKIYSNIKAGPNKIYPYTLIMQNADGRWESIAITNPGTGSSHAANTKGFLVSEVYVMYANATYNENNNVGTYNIYSAHSNLIDVRYSFNLTSSAGFTGYKPVYIVGTIGSDGLFYLDITQWWSQTLPTSDDGKAYLYIGDAYDWYRITLNENKYVYFYRDNRIQMYAPGRGIKTITRSGTTFTVTRDDGSTFTFSQQDNNSVTGVKGNAESSYRTGNVNLTPANILNTGTTAQFWRGDNSWSNILTQTDAATLGIDTSNSKIGTAVRTLHIATSNSGSGTGVTDGQAAGLTFGIATAAYAGIYYQSSGSYGSRLYFATTGSFANGAYARMMITHDGKVGIGTTSPSTLLHVAGDVTVTGLTASQAVSTDANKKLVSTNLTVSDPTASGTGITYIATISQSAVGKITVTKSTVRSASTSQTGVLQFTAENTNAQLNTLTTGSSTPTDADYYISQYVGGGTTTTTYHRRPMSALWDYIKGKITNGIYWANEKATSSASYKTTPEVAKIKLNGNTSASAASTKNVELVYDATLEVLNFVFS